MSEKKNTDKKTLPLYGLILSGGKSTRMGMDKGQLAYHGVPQREYLYQLLENVCDKVFISIRDEQQDSLDPAFNFITDEDQYRGPFNGILSAHAQFPEIAWMVLACDLPLIDLTTLKQLRDFRDEERVATAMATKKTRLPEPLAAIWEPAGLKKAVAYMSGAAGSCPRKFLIKSDTRLVYPERDELLCNANSIEDYREVQTQLASR